MIAVSIYCKYIFATIDELIHNMDKLFKTLDNLVEASLITLDSLNYIITLTQIYEWMSMILII